MRYLYVANWKMNMTVHDSVEFCTKHCNMLQDLTLVADIVLCPSFIALLSVSAAVKNSAIAVGAQNCSEHTSGPYTGEVSAQSLAGIGITYCIVGHSERRIYYHETTEHIIQKIKLLYHNNIQPIICIGETAIEFNNKQTLNILKQQLEPIIQEIAHNNRIIIAYEPVWAIGTGMIPEQEHLHTVFTCLSNLLQQHCSLSAITLLYGGSVNPTNIGQLKSIALINGFLIGGASTDFETFAHIINFP